jgi:phosphoglycerate dehydrogenase-like enzyme
VIKSAFFNNDTRQHSGHVLDNVYQNGRRERIGEISDLYPEVVSAENFDEHVDQLQDLEVIFSTWGMPQLSDAQVKKLPSLKAVFYAAGATNQWREPFIENGITVCSATAANAIPVAEFTLGQILLACKCYHRNTRMVTSESVYWDVRQNQVGPGVYDETVTIIGNGTISNLLQDFLKSFSLEVLVVPSRAEKRTVSLEEAFAKSLVVVNLLPDRDDNVGILNKALFESMPQMATFINVGRGRQVNEDDLVEVCNARPDFTALLDVQHPEAPVEGSPLYSTPNIQLTTHIAGSMRNELARMADYMIEEFLRFEKGETLLHEVDPTKL